MTPLPSNKPPLRGFSLVEVIVAIGVFSLVILAVFGLLTPLFRDSTAVIESSTATRLAEGINRELERVGGNTVSTLGATVLYLVATSDGGRVLRTQQTATGGNPSSNAAFPAENDLDATPVPGIAQRDRYYLVEVRLLANDGADTDDNIYYQANDGAVPVEVRVTWPFYSPTTPVPTTLTALNWNSTSVSGQMSPPASRSVYLFAAAVRR